jgi:hypothetical protein
LPGFLSTGEGRPEATLSSDYFEDGISIVKFYFDSYFEAEFNSFYNLASISSAARSSALST